MKSWQFFVTPYRLVEVPKRVMEDVRISGAPPSALDEAKRELAMMFAREHDLFAMGETEWRQLEERMQRIVASSRLRAILLDELAGPFKQIRGCISTARGLLHKSSRDARSRTTVPSVDHSGSFSLQSGPGAEWRSGKAGGTVRTISRGSGSSPSQG